MGEKEEGREYICVAISKLEASRELIFGASIQTDR